MKLPPVVIVPDLHGARNWQRVAITVREVASSGSTNPLAFPIAATFFTQLRSRRPETKRTMRICPTRGLSPSLH